MRGFNQVIVMGNITKDVECKVSAGGAEYASFGIAVNESYKDKSGSKVEKTTFVNAVAFGNTAKVAGNYLRKGSSVFIRGSLQITKKQTQTGENREYASVKVDELVLLSSGNGGKSEAFNPSESLDNYFPKDNTAGYGKGEYANRPYPKGAPTSAPESIREELKGIDPSLDTNFDFGANVDDAPWNIG